MSKGGDAPSAAKLARDPEALARYVTKRLLEQLPPRGEAAFYPEWRELLSEEDRWGEREHLGYETALDSCTVRVTKEPGYDEYEITVERFGTPIGRVTYQSSSGPGGQLYSRARSLYLTQREAAVGEIVREIEGL